MHIVMIYSTFEKLKQKEVVDASDGKKLGYICDIGIDIGTGRIDRIILPKNCKWYNPFNDKNKIAIPWSDIQKIGDDVILVNICGCTVK